MTKHFLRRYFSVGQRTTQWHCSGCVATHCYHEGSGSLTWRVNGRYLVCMAWPSQHCTAPT